MRIGIGIILALFYTAIGARAQAPNCTATVTNQTPSSFTINVSCPAPTAPLSMATPIQLPPAKAGVPYSVNIFQLGQVSGGTPPYTLSCTGLPAWLTCDANGTISGTPAPSSAAYNFSFVVKDSSGAMLTSPRRRSTDKKK